MADNTTLNAGAGGDTIAADDIAGIKHQRVKISQGADGSATDVSSAAPLNVIAASNSGVDVGDVTVNNGVGASAVPIQDGGNSITVDGSLTTVSTVSTITNVVHVDDNAGTLSIDDGAGSITVDGAVATTNAGTFVVQENGAALTSLQLIDDTVFAEDVAAQAADKGLAVLAVRRDADTSLVGTDNDYANLQVNANGALKVEIFDGGDSHTVDGTVAVTNAGLTALNGAIAGTEVQVDVLTMPSTTVTATNLDVRDLVAASDAVTVHGDVGVVDQLDLTNSNPLTVAITDANGDQVTSFGGGTEYAEDTASAAAEKVTMAGVVRKDTGASLVDADGDRTELQVDSAGALRVTGGGGGTEYVVNAVAPADPTGATFVMERDDALSALAEVEGDWTQPRSNANGALWVAHDGAVAVTDNGGNLSIDDGGNSITVDNATISVVGSGTEATAQRVTIATDSTGVLSVDDNGGALTVDNGGTFAVQVDGSALTALQKIDDPVLVDDAAFTPAASSVMMAGFQFDNVATDSVDEGDAGAARMSANRNVLMNIRDSAGNERGANVNASNQLSVSVDNSVTVSSHAVTNAGTFAVQVDGSALTALQKIDDPVLVDDAGFTPATSSVSMAGFQFDDVAPDSVDEGDAGAARMSANRNIYTTIRDAAGNERGVNVTASNQLNVIDANSATALTSLQLIDDPVATLGTTTYTETTTKGMIVGAVRRDADTTLVDTTNEVGPLQMDANGRLKVEAFSGEILPVSGTITASNTAGDIAHDTGDSGNPVKIGAKAVSAEPAVVTANDRVNIIADLVGKQIVLPYSNPENFVSGAITTAMTATTSTSLIASPGAGLRNYVTQITVSNAHATVGTDVIIQDGSGGTTLYTIPAAAVYGGAAVSFPCPLRQPTAATALFCANVTTGASTKVSASGYKGV